MDNQMIIPPQNELTAEEKQKAYRQQINEEANRQAAGKVFSGFNEVKSERTLRTYKNGLALFADILNSLGWDTDADSLQNDAEAWREVEHGLVDKFREMLLKTNYSVGSVNAYLTAVRKYAKLATEAGTMGQQTYALINLIKGYSGTEKIRIDEDREITRKQVVSYTRNGQEITRHGVKKARHTKITPGQAEKLLKELKPENPVQARDAFMFILMASYSLRVSEVAALTFSGEAYDKETDSNQPLFFDADKGRFSVHRIKTNKVQTIQLRDDHKVLAQTYLAARPECDHAMIFVGSTRHGGLTNKAMLKRAIGKRICFLGKKYLEIDNLSPHDLRHFYATESTGSIDRLRDGGGWDSYAMLNRYRHGHKIANEGVTPAI